MMYVNFPPIVPNQAQLQSREMTSCVSGVCVCVSLPYDFIVLLSQMYSHTHTHTDAALIATFGSHILSFVIFIKLHK